MLVNLMEKYLMLMLPFRDGVLATLIFKKVFIKDKFLSQRCATRQSQFNEGDGFHRPIEAFFLVS